MERAGFSDEGNQNIGSGPQSSRVSGNMYAGAGGYLRAHRFTRLPSDMAWW